MKKLIAGLMLVPCMAMAEFRTGNQLLSDLQSTETVNKIYALGYIVGVADSTRSTYHCMPNNATAGQIQDMVKNHLESNPQFRHYTADIIITFVLKQAWPCSAKGKGV